MTSLLAGKRRVVIGCALLLGSHTLAQNPGPAAAGTPAQAIKLAQGGRCAEALPLLKREQPRLAHSADKALKYSAAMAMVRCAMALDQEQSATEILLQMKRDFPGDPEVLYMATHYFSELGIRAAQQLQAQAPSSSQARRLEAEALESQGKNDEAAAIYNAILQADPKTPGIHYRLGQIDLDRAGASGSTDEAKREFEQEISVDPANASAQFILGELARRAGQWDEAILHFSQATKLDAGFAEAYLALGLSLAASGKSAEAVSPLEAYVKMQPGDPAGHYQLALAYSRGGNKAGAAREMALQAEAESHAKSSTDTAEGHAVHP